MSDQENDSVSHMHGESAQGQQDTSDVGSSSSALPPPPVITPSADPIGELPATGSGASRSKVLVAIGVVAVLLIGAVFLVTRGGGAVSADSVTVAVDTRGDNGSVYLTTIKDGAVQIQGQVVSGGLADVSVYNSIDSTLASVESLIALDRNTLMYWKWEDDDFDRAQLFKFDAKTSVATSVYSGSDVEAVRYIVDTRTWFFYDDGSCMTLVEDGVASRIGPGRCWLAAGKMYLTQYEDDEMSVVEVGDDGVLKPSYVINLGMESIRSSDDGSVVYGTDADGGVAVYSLAGGQRIWSKGSGDVRIQMLSLSTDGRSFLVAVDDTSERDNKSDLVLVKFIDGVASESTLVSDYEVGGAIAPDGNGALVFTRSQDSEDGSIAMYDSKFTAPKPVSSGIVVESVYRTSAGGLVVVSNKQVHVGTFEDGVSERHSQDIYYSTAFVSPDEKAILLTLVEPGDDGKQSLLLLRPEFVGEKATAEVVQSGQSSFDLSPTSFTKKGVLVFATRDDGYTTIYQRGLEAGSELGRIGEGRLAGYEVIADDQVRFFESIGSDGKDGTRTYGVSGTKAAERETLSESYRLLELPIGPRPATGTSVNSSFSSATTFVDTDFERCSNSALPVLSVGDSTTFDIAQNSSGSMMWTDFCVGPSDGASVQFSTTVDYTNPMGYSYYSSGRLWVRLLCEDSEKSGTSFDESNSAYSGFSGPGGSLNFEGYVFCRIGDYKDHSARGYYSEYAQGGRVTVRVDSYGGD